MPGKVNPVIPEAIGQIALQVMSNDNLVAMTAGLGQLELNQYFPLLAHTILKSLLLLTNAAHVFAVKCVVDIKANADNCFNHLMNSKSIATYLVPLFGYDKVEDIIKKTIDTDTSIKDVVMSEGLLTEDEFNRLLQPQRMYKLGFTKDDY